MKNTDLLLTTRSSANAKIERDADVVTKARFVNPSRTDGRPSHRKS